VTAALADIVALTPTQRGMCAASFAAEGPDPYTVTFSLRLSGTNDAEPLRLAVAALLARYPHLGARVHTAGLPHPVLLIPAAPQENWEEIDLRSAGDPEAAADQLYLDEGLRRLDLAAGPLIRVVCARVAETEHHIIFTAHHIVIDGASVPILFGDLAALLAGGGALLPAAPPIREHAAWLAAQPAGAATEAWREALRGIETGSILVPPAPEKPAPPHIGAAALSLEDSGAVAAWARANGLTLNTVFQLAWARVLSGLLGRDDVVFAQTSSGRDPALPSSLRMVGALIATAPVRARVADEPPAALGARLQQEVSQLRRHGHLGLGQIAAACGVRPLCDTLLVFENMEVVGEGAEIALPGGAGLRAGRVDSLSDMPLVVVPTVSEGKIAARVEIRPDLAARLDPAATARRFLAVARRLADADSLAAISILLDGEAASFGPAGELGADDRTVPQALAAALAARPDAPAVVDRHGTQTAGEFRAAIATLRDGLRAWGVHPTDAVAVMLRRDRRVLAAPFAIAETGALCVHVDPETPPGRLAAIMEASGARFLLAEPLELPGDVCLLTPDLDGSLRAPELDRTEGALPRIDPGRPFYAIFTSGTTGKPKGVVATHRSLLAFWRHHHARVYGNPERQLRVGHNWSTGFDAAWQPAVALLSGHAVAIVPDEARADPRLLISFIRDHQLDFLETSPSMFLRLADAGLISGRGGVERCDLPILGLGGEAIPDSTWQRIRRLSGTRALNFYGPTEATVDAFMADSADYERTCIGEPTATMTAEILDHRLRPLPPGGFGELYLSGPQLAMGYLSGPGLTAAAFVAGPGGRRRYRTGDLVCRNPDGGTAYLGRADAQTKINGYRVEPSEVAAALRSLPGVRGAEVVVAQRKGRSRLAALAVTAEPVARLRALLAEVLPRFMIPSLIVAVDEIPLNRNDKLDRAAVDEILAAAEPVDCGPAPATATEGVLAEITGLAADSALSDELDSLAVMDLVTKLRGRGHQVSPADVLAAADLRELATLLDENAGASLST
jgi:mycobactin peptide synthetase MbtF